MNSLMNEKYVKENNVTDFMSEEQREYFSKKLLEAEKHNLANPNMYTFDEFQDKIKNKYGI